MDIIRWNGAFIILLVVVTTRFAYAQENEELESTTILDTTNDEDPSSTENQVQLDSRLRTALLKALTDLEKEGNSEAQNIDYNADSARDVAKAQASAVTIFEDDKPTLTTSEEQIGGHESKDDKDVLEAITTTEPEEEEDPSKQKAEIVILQKSESLQGPTITSFDETPLDPLKDVENIITSATNNFQPENSEHQSEARSTSKTVASKNSDFQTDSNNLDTATKTSSFASFNAISDNESKKPSKPTITEKSLNGKVVNEANFVKTYIKPLGLNINSGTDFTNYTPINVTPNTETFDAKSSQVKAFEREILNEKQESAEVVTEKVAEVSTEENEAKVEQVQFFSAPLVAAFTVHQDEKGQPKKVEPIYKNGLNSKKGSPLLLQQQQDQINLQSSTFNNLGLQQKQEILEQEIEKLRKQQTQLLNSNNFLTTQNFINPDTNNQAQSNFKQAVNQNFNKLDPIFNEPDRSVVAKLATIDPSKILLQNPEPVLNRFTPNEAILPRANTVSQINTNRITPEPQSTLKAPKAGSDVSLVPSITFDPLIEAGKLPENAQILPNKEPTGFHNFVKLARPEHNLVYSQLNQNNIASNVAPRPQQNLVQPSLGPVQPHINNFIASGNNQPNKVLKQVPFQGFGTQLHQNNQNRYLRQELGTGNLGLNQQSISIVPADQPFAPILELGYFPDNNRFLRQQTQNFDTNHLNIDNYRSNIDGSRNVNTGFQSFPVLNSAPNTQNQNRFFRSNLEGTLTSPQKVSIQSSLQPNLQQFGPQPLEISSQTNRFFRSNQEGSLSKPEDFGYIRPQDFSQVNRFLRSNQEGVLLRSQSGFAQAPVIQKYRYSSSFGFPKIPLH